MKKFLPLSLAVILVLALVLAGCGGGGETGKTGDTPPTFPSPWLHQDIGTGMTTGTASYSKGTFTIAGAGFISDYTQDKAHFVYQALPATNNFVMTARVVTMDEDEESVANVGLMVRCSLAADSAMAQYNVAPPQGTLQLYLQTRSTNGGSAIGEARSLPVGDVPVYLRITKNGSGIYGAWSTDGSTWSTEVLIMTALPNSTTVYVGMGVTSYEDNLLETATFDNVTLVSSIPEEG